MALSGGRSLACKIPPLCYSLSLEIICHLLFSSQSWMGTELFCWTLPCVRSPMLCWWQWIGTQAQSWVAGHHLLQVRTKEPSRGGAGFFILYLKRGYQVLLTTSSYPRSCVLWLSEILCVTLESHDQICTLATLKKYPDGFLSAGSALGFSRSSRDLDF